MTKFIILLMSVTMLEANSFAQLAPGSPSSATPTAPANKSLTEARRAFKTKVTDRKPAKDPVPDPPPSIFSKTKYPSAAGALAAYLSPDPKDGKKHPAIIWITGGDCNSIGEIWEAAPADNDQTAAAYRKAGIIMMFPSLRGGNDNPGVKESFFGEVDDVLAAAEFLAQQPYVDPNRIYLGGHSTGGTLALLGAESSAKFRAIFSFGPVHDVRGYGPDFMPFDATNRTEVELRAPILWLHSIKSPTFVFEGTLKGNLQALQAMDKANSNPQVHFLPVRGASHFTILQPTNRLIVDKILHDDGPTCKLSFLPAELDKLFPK